MGSTKTTTQNGTQTSAPPSWTMPGISDVASRVTGALNNLPGQKYVGDFVAQPNQGLTDQAIGAYTGAAGRVPGLIDTLSNSMAHIQAPRAYDLGGNYDINPAIDAATRPLFQQLTQQTLPGIKSSSLDAGAYTGDRAMGVIPGHAIGEAAQHAQDLGATIGYQDYQDRENRRLQAYGLDQGNDLQAAGMLPGLSQNIMQLATGAGDLYKGAADIGAAADQAGINNALAKNQYDYQYPFQGLDIASSLLQQLSGNYGTTTSTGTTTEKTGGLGSVVQGLSGVAALAASLYSGGATGGASSGAGGILGGLSHLFGSGASSGFTPTQYVFPGG